MNLGGIKVGSAEIEHAALGVEALSEVEEIAIDPPGGGPSRLVPMWCLTPVPTSPDS